MTNDEKTRDVLGLAPYGEAVRVDLHRLDRELDHLRSLGLLDAHTGFKMHAQDKIADVTPSTLGLQMFARCRGCRGSPEAFFGLGI